MAYPTSIIRLSVGGSTAGEDEWSNGMTLAGGGDQGNLESFLSLTPDQFITAVNAFYATGVYSTAVYNTVSWIKLALIGKDGKYLRDAKIYDYPTPRQGTGSLPMSPQDSLVLSLLTGTKRGLARRGRIYLPAGFAPPAVATGRVAPADVTAVVTKSQTYLRAINAIASANNRPLNLVIASDVREGALRAVTGLEIGNLVDNQARRRNRLQEVYVEAPLATTV